MSGIWKRRHGQIFRHRQPKGSGTVKAGPTSTAPDLDSTLSRGFPVGLAYGEISNLGKIGIGLPSSCPVGKPPHCKARKFPARNWSRIFSLVVGITGLTKSA